MDQEPYQDPEIPDEETHEWTDAEAEAVPVERGRCVWCKIPRDEWEDGVEAVTVDNGETTETLCSSCHTDLRLYKRVYTVQVTAHEGFPPEVKRAIGRHFTAMQEEIEELYDGDPVAVMHTPMQSNAASGRHPMPEDHAAEAERRIDRGGGAAYGATEDGEDEDNPVGTWG